MAKRTFNNLSVAKQEAFVRAAYEEFASRTFNDASISRIVKKLGIAKGSVYQYFDDKKALYFFLKERAEAKKRTTLEGTLTQGYADFWELYRRLYVAGVQFDLDHPLHSAFLYNFSQEKGLPEIAPLIKQQFAAGIAFFRQRLAEEQQLGRLKSDLDPELMAYLIIQAGRGMVEWLAWKHDIDFQENAQGTSPVLDTHQEKLLQLVDDLAHLLKFGMHHD